MINGEPITRAMMDIAFQVILIPTVERVISEPSLDMSLADAFQWICVHPPASDWVGLRVIPRTSNGCWSLLVEEYRGPATDR